MDVICTIIASNYIPQAMALRDSVLGVHPDLDFYVLIADATSREQPLLHGAKILLTEDLEIDDEIIKEMFSYYDLFEISTALKPFLLKSLLSSGVDTVTFLDPDIIVHAPLTLGFDAAREFGIVLCPHRLTPSNILTNNFSELGFLKYGVYNLGYIAVGKTSLPMLIWWQDRLRWFCSRYQGEVWFTDQKWLDLVPALFECKVLKHTGYDLAPWNIDERLIQELENVVYCGADPLIFIHFSQMSANLALGIETPLWDKQLSTLPKKQASATLDYIKEQTSSYSQKLVRYRSQYLSAERSSQLKVTAHGISFHNKKRKSLKSLRSARSGEIKIHAKNPLKRPPDWFNAVSKTLERSATLNGMRDGIRIDIEKLIAKWR